MLVRGRRLRRTLERGQVRAGRVEVVDRARVAQLHEPAADGARERLDERPGHQARRPGRGASRGDAVGTSAGQPASPRKAGRRTAARSVPWASMSEVTVSASDPAHPRRPDEGGVGAVDLGPGDVDPADRSGPRGRPRRAPGRRARPREPARASATAPSGSSETTTIGRAPPAHAVSTSRRTFGDALHLAQGRPGRAARITAATVTAGCYRATCPPHPPRPAMCDDRRAHDRQEPRPAVPTAAPRRRRRARPRAPPPRPRADALRADLRNVAIVAHVDHGKTTLVDGILRQTGAFRANQAVVDRVMDSGDLEREKGITILAKQTTVDYAGIRINIVDTPGHADFGGEVERSLNLVDAVLLLVDAAEGPLPQTRYVLQKAMARRLPVVVALNKIDRGDARPAEVLDDGLRALHGPRRRRAPDRVPGRLHERQGRPPRPATWPSPGPTCGRSSTSSSRSRRRPSYAPGHPLQLLVTNLSANDYVGRMAVGRVVNGAIRVGQRISVVREEPDDTAGSIEPGRTVTLSGTVTSLQTAHGIERMDIEEAGPGDIVSVAGLPEVTIGDTLTDPATHGPLPRIEVDEPTLRMTFGVNTSPLSGREGRYLTSRQLRARLEKEILGNVAIQFFPTETGDTYEVRGRGELQLAVLVEQMRREGYELQVSRPEVILHTVAGEVQEPYERITIDIPPDYIGEIQTALAGRKGRLEQMTTDADGRVRMEFVLPVRGLIGYRGQLLTETRGTALLHQIGEGYGPWAGEVTHRTNGVLVADRSGVSNAYALFNLQERSELFVGAGVDVYEGMVVGENARSGDMDVNVDQGEEADEHPDPRPRRGAPPDAAAADDPGVGDRVHRRGRAGRGHARLDPAP